MNGNRGTFFIGGWIPHVMVVEKNPNVKKSVPTIETENLAKEFRNLLRKFDSRTYVLNLDIICTGTEQYRCVG